jgi:hypothetical protein
MNCYLVATIAQEMGEAVVLIPHRDAASRALGLEGARAFMRLADARAVARGLADEYAARAADMTEAERLAVAVIDCGPDGCEPVAEYGDARALDAWHNAEAARGADAYAWRDL